MKLPGYTSGRFRLKTVLNNSFCVTILEINNDTAHAIGCRDVGLLFVMI